MTAALSPSAATLLRLLTAAAAAGRPCPGNDALATQMGLGSVSGPTKAMNALERAGLIRTWRFTRSRVVEIVATGARTAGSLDKAPARRPDSPGTWNEARDATLRTLWAEGSTAGAIAQHLGLTKNQVMARVWRLRLGARGSPIKPRDPHAPAKLRASPVAPRGAAQRLAPVPVRPAPVSSLKLALPVRRTVAETTAPAGPHFGGNDSARALAPRRRGNQVNQPPLRRLAPGAIPPARTCQWPLWPDAAPRGARAPFCGAPSIQGCSYCEAHQALSLGRGTVAKRAAEKTLLACAAA